MLVEVSYAAANSSSPRYVESNEQIGVFAEQEKLSANCVATTRVPQPEASVSRDQPVEAAD